ncbi:hypothetical protein ACWDX6_30090 [Streptomyces sp. NPDC003027]
MAPPRAAVRAVRAAPAAASPKPAPRTRAPCALALVAGTVILLGGAVFTFTPWARLRR